MAAPPLASRIQRLKPSLYARVLARLAEYEGERYPFHIGETHLLPECAVKEALQRVDDKTVHRYGNSAGIPELREAIANYMVERGHGAVGADDIVVSHGATHGLHLACMALLDPGDEIILLSPHWPLIGDMALAAGAKVVEVPFTQELRNSSQSVEDILSPHLSSRTKAVYITTPNNPDGVVLHADERAQLAKFLCQHDLYALVDEAYERFSYDLDAGSMRAEPGMEERTVSVFTFSKSHRMAGLRIGWVAAPPKVRQALVKLTNISIYNVGLLVQRAALIALTECQDTVIETRDAAKKARDLACSAMAELPGFRFIRPEGGAYVFADLSELLGDRDCFDLLDACLDEGVVFAPGIGFGDDFSHWGRFCFTAMEPAHLQRGIESLAKVAAGFRK